MLRVLFLGKTKEGFISEGIEEYFKRLKKFVKIEIVILKDFEFNFKESFLILFDLNGEPLSSEEFASNLKKIINKDIVVILGDEKGIPPQIKERANLTINISRMTFTHELARLIIMEQLYRAYTIINNLNYHK